MVPLVLTHSHWFPKGLSGAFRSHPRRFENRGPEYLGLSPSGSPLQPHTRRRVFSFQGDLLQENPKLVGFPFGWLSLKNDQTLQFRGFPPPSPVLPDLLKDMANAVVGDVHRQLCQVNAGQGVHRLLSRRQSSLSR